MKKLLQFAGVVALVAFSYAVAIAIPREIEKTREALQHEVAETRAETGRQLEAIQKRTLAEIRTARKDLLHLADDRLRAAQLTLDQSERDLNAQLARANEHVETLVANVTEIKDRALEREPIVYSRFLATTGELNRTLDAGRRMAEAGAKAAPEITEDVTRITGAAADYIAPKEPPKKKPFYIRWLPTIAVTAGKILF